MEHLTRSPYAASISISTSGRDSPVVFAPNSESEEWIREWEAVEARELIDSPLVSVDAETSVEEACDTLLSNNASCIAITDDSHPPHDSPFLGLFDFADVNAFLSLAASQHTKSADEYEGSPRAQEIVNAAKAGKVPVRLVSNLSEKDPLEVLPESATLVDLLRVFATGTHRILIRSNSTDTPEPQYLGFISDRSLLSFFHVHAQTSAPLSRFLANGLHSLALPSLSLRTAVVSCTASSHVHEAMKAMSVQGVSSIAVVEDGPAAGPGSQMTLLSAVSVTDIGKIVVPAQSNQILQMPLKQFVAQIKEPEGSTDGEDKYPVYSVSASSTLRFAIEKILATNAHRVFVIEDPRSGGSSPVLTGSPALPPGAGPGTGNGNGRASQLRGVVSVVDILALFARLAGLQNVDPLRMQRHRRASSASASASAGSGGAPPSSVGVGAGYAKRVR